MAKFLTKLVAIGKNYYSNVMNFIPIKLELLNKNLFFNKNYCK